MNRGNEVGNEILRQLGGSGRLSVMLGAHSFAAGDFGEGEYGLSFKIKARAKNGAKAVIVTLNANDLYNVKFLAMRKFEVKNVGELENVYVDNLKPMLEDKLGLHLSL